MIERGERIALVGVNGAGKSTLIKLLAGQEPLTAGEYKLGHNVEPDYFAQDQYKELDPEARILDDLGELSPSSTQTQLRSLLGCFLFSGDDVFKRIGVLSGGERNRYALLKMLLHPANFLLLDEPTNHLDLRAKDVLLEALVKYTGTVVFVSHDRYFIDKLATRVFEIGDGKVEIYPGNYEDYLWRKQGGAAQQTAAIQNDLASERPADRAREEAKTAATPTNGNAPSADAADCQSQAPEPHQAQANARPPAGSRRRNQQNRSGHRAKRDPTPEFRQRRRNPAPNTGTRQSQERSTEPDEGVGRTIGLARNCRLDHVHHCRSQWRRCDIATPRGTRTVR